MALYSGEKFPKPAPEQHPLVEAINRVFFWFPGIKQITGVEE